MKKRILIIFIMLFLLVVQPIEAGWFSSIDDLIKGVQKYGDDLSKNEKRIIKEDSENTAKKSDDLTTKKTTKGDGITGYVTKVDDMTKTVDNLYATKSSKKLDDLVESECFRRPLCRIKSGTEQQGLKSQIKGELWEKEVKKTFQAMGKRYFSSSSDAEKWIKSTYSSFDESFVLGGGKETKGFINKYIDNTFTAEPDFIEITVNKRQITKLDILDAKASNSAVTSSATQKNNFINLCSSANKQGISCSLTYAQPKSTLTPKQLVNAVCYATLVTVVPDPVDVVCLIVGFS